MNENVGKCVTVDATRKIKFEKNQQTGSVKKVYFITHKQKCSQDPEVLKLEDIEPKETIPENSSDEDTDANSIGIDEDMETIKESFKRFLKGVI